MSPTRPVRKVLAISLFLLLTSCLNWYWEKPTFTPKEISVTRLSMTEVHLLFGIEVQNPNRFDLKIRELEYTIYLNEEEVGRGRLGREVMLAASKATMVEVPLAADFKRIGNPLGLFLGGKDLKYKIEGAAIVKASLGTATFPFSKSGEIKLKR